MPLVRGGSGSDSLQGTTSADTILGFQGDDTIQGNGGNDTIFGGQGNDQITFGVGNNTNFDQPGANGSSSVFGGEGADVITSLGGLGNNTVSGGTGIPSVDARLDGGDFIDLTQDRGVDIVTGNYGDDEIAIGVGGASAFGGMGNDVIADRGSTLYEDATGEDTTFAPGQNPGGGQIRLAPLGEVQQLDAVNPNIYGSANDVIFGGEGSDVIDLSTIGNATIVGGTGNPAVDVSLDGADLIKIENATADSTNGIPTGLVANDLILGNYGDDTIDAGNFVNLFGEDGPVLNTGSDSTQGGQGQARGGSDTLVGGMGNDLIYSGEQSNDIILGNQGNDVIVAVESRAGTDTIYGGLGDDTITAGNNSADGAAATGVNELVYGGEGNDFIQTEGTGNDTLYGGVDSTGGSADGSNAFDLVNQFSGNDLIYGGPNPDYFLVGGTGADATMTGGAGADTFSFFGDTIATSSSGYDGNARDVITDFVSGTDKIDNTQRVQNAVVVTAISNNASTAIAAADAAQGTNSTATDSVNAVLFQTVAGGDHYLVIDNDHNGTYTAGTDLLIDVKGLSTISGGDFLFATANPAFPGPS